MSLHQRYRVLDESLECIFFIGFILLRLVLLFSLIAYWSWYVSFYVVLYPKLRIRVVESPYFPFRPQQVDCDHSRPLSSSSGCKYTSPAENALG